MISQTIHRPAKGGLFTHSSPAMRLPLTAFFQTSDIPPAWLAPTTMTASWPANITTVWNTSVQITAFRPPWETGTQGLNTSKFREIKNIFKCNKYHSDTHIDVLDVMRVTPQNYLNITSELSFFYFNAVFLDNKFKCIIEVNNSNMRVWKF